MTSIPRIELAAYLVLTISLSLTWLMLLTRQLYARRRSRKYTCAPCYPDHASQMIGVLQQIQTLYSSNPTGVRLSDIHAFCLDLQQAHGEHTTLETVIQQLVGQQLRQQLHSRRATRAQQKVLVAA